MGEVDGIRLLDEAMGAVGRLEKDTFTQQLKVNLAARSLG